MSAAPVVRCGIYTRKSTEEGLEQEFNSLMAQREAAEAYILSQREQGWTVIPEHYDDGGFSGGNMDRPALKRLLADVESKKIDCVVVYKVDRLSRSLFDFATIISVLEKHAATFVSVTQQFNTNTSLGRLTLNVLLSFAQFERELTRERTRDKVFAARRKGKWTGGHPTLGYDLAPGGGKLVVNETEAHQVREIFRIFLRTRKLIETLAVIENNGWHAKSWTTRDGGIYGGSRFNRHTLVYLLSNPIYIGKVRLKGELHDGEHPGIIEPKIWRRAAELLGQTIHKSKQKQPQQAPLRGLLYCRACNAQMVPAYTKRKNTKVRYYTCRAAQMRGWKSCPSKTVPAQEIEEAVFSRMRINGTSASEGRIERIAYDGQTRQVTIHLREPCDGAQVITFALSPKPERSTRRRRRTGRLPRIARLMALALRFERLLASGAVGDFADLARLGRVTRARISQIMNLLNLAPDLQERLLFLEPVYTWRDELSERNLRRVVEEVCWMKQRRLFDQLVRHTPNGSA